MQSVDDLISITTSTPDSIEFTDVMDVIDNHYDFTPVTFRCGAVENEAGTNQGSCKILAFAKLHQLSDAATLSLFGRFYRDDVLRNPDGDDHGNIRNFMKNSWQGVSFESEPLLPKAPAT
jgi:hypothetical protein